MAATTARSWSAAIHAAHFTEVNEDDRHEHQDVRVEDGVQYVDLPEFVDFDYIARVAKVNAATLAGLASAPGTMQDVRVHTGQLSVDTDLVEWAPSPEADLAGYEIVYRDHDRAVLDAHDQGPEGHDALRGEGDHQGQLHVRGAGRRHRRQPQPGGLPRAGPLTQRSASSRNATTRCS